MKQKIMVGKYPVTLGGSLVRAQKAWVRKIVMDQIAGELCDYALARAQLYEVERGQEVPDKKWREMLMKALMFVAKRHELRGTLGWVWEIIRRDIARANKEEINQ
jgi:hypothetical protein